MGQLTSPRWLVVGGILAPAIGLLSLTLAAIPNLNGPTPFGNVCSIIGLVLFWLGASSWLGALLFHLVSRQDSRRVWIAMGALGGIVPLIVIQFVIQGVFVSQEGFRRALGDILLLTIFGFWLTVPLGALAGAAISSLPPFARRSVGKPIAATIDVQAGSIVSELPAESTTPISSADPWAKALAWCSALLSMLHFPWLIPAVLSALFLTVGLDVGDIGGHPRHVTWAEQAPYHLTMLAVSAPMLFLALVLLRAGRALALQTDDGPRAARLSGSTAGVLATLAGVAMVIVSFVPHFGSGSDRSTVVWLLALAIWINGTYAALAWLVVRSANRKGLLKSWTSTSAMLLLFVVAYASIVGNLSRHDQMESKAASPEVLKGTDIPSK